MASLNELSKQLNINKSKLIYYNSIGLISPITTIGRMYIYDETKIMKRLKAIFTRQKKGQNLKEIKATLCNKNCLK